MYMFMVAPPPQDPPPLFCSQIHTMNIFSILSITQYYTFNPVDPFSEEGHRTDRLSVSLGAKHEKPLQACEERISLLNSEVPPK